jgi:hypothetical protein
MTSYSCDNTERRAELIRWNLTAEPAARINAFDFVEVEDSVLDAVVSPGDDPRQLLLLVRFLQPLRRAHQPPTGQQELGVLRATNVSITGGTTITGIQARWALRLEDLAEAPPPSEVAREYLERRKDALSAIDADEPKSWLAVWVSQRGDYSPYTLGLIAGVSSDEAPASFDPVLSQVRFSFKVECPSDFDCEQETVCATSDAPAPALDYLARDYQSFRRLMLDRLSVLLPEFRERSPADLGVTLVELLAHAADLASYQQDSVATEAYLSTARLRTSVRRHARLLDYRLHEGCSARALVQLVLVEGQRIDAPLIGPVRFSTRVADAGVVVRSSDEASALEQNPEVFEALHEVSRLTSAHNEIHFHTWGETRCVLPRGATSATLRAARVGDVLALAAGDILVFEEVRHPETGQVADADPARRHAVRLTEPPTKKRDALYGVPVWEVKWHAEDALPFPLCLWEVKVSDQPLPVSVSRGNIVLSDHGRRRASELLVPAEVPLQGRYRPHLGRDELTWRVPYAPELTRSVRASLVQDPREALPVVELLDGDDRWVAVGELLSSDPFARELVVEMEDDGRAYLRFGDGVLGRRPPAGVQLLATYRTGSGAAGNVGAEAVQHVLSDELSGAVARVRNPLPAVGGLDREPLQAAKLQAPAAFRVQRRAVTAQDWADMAQGHPGVQRAVAEIRWTGSWSTVFLTVDPVGGREVDAAFVSDLRAFLEPFRLAGLDLELRPPTYVPLDVALVICVSPEYFVHEVRAGVTDRLTSGVRKDGSLGFFHPDRLSFGQPVYISPLVAEVMAVPGVSFVDLDPVTNGSDRVRFQRLRKKPAGELAAGVMVLASLEVARLDNDLNRPENGRLRLTLRGGR